MSLLRTYPSRKDQGMLLYGIFPPITTPFYPDGNIYFKKLERTSSAIRERRLPASWCWARPAKLFCSPMTRSAKC